MILTKADEPALQAYFDANVDETVWLRIAARENETMIATRDGDRITGVAMHAKSNGVLQLHGASPIELAREAQREGERVTAVAGLPAQVEEVRAALFAERRVTQLSHEIMMSVDVDKLVLPEILSQPNVSSRRAGANDRDLLVRWRRQYFLEVHSLIPDASAVAEVDTALEAGLLWVLEVDGEVVNTAAFSAVFEKLVQIEYAYGPKELRAKKYGRSAVAGALKAVEHEGITHAVFNTAHDNTAVQQGIAPIGFRKTGDYHVAIFA